MRNTPRANIINALHALENGKPADEVRAWLQDAIDDLKPVERVSLPAVEGYVVSQVGPVVSVRYPDGDEFARCILYTTYVIVHLRDRPPVHVRTLEAAIDYIKLVAALK